MNGPLSRLRSLIRRASDEVRAITEEEDRYNQCVKEWNEHFFEDDWCDSARAAECSAYIEWFETSRR